MRGNKIMQESFSSSMHIHEIWLAVFVMVDFFICDLIPPKNIDRVILN